MGIGACDKAQGKYTCINVTLLTTSDISHSLARLLNVLTVSQQLNMRLAARQSTYFPKKNHRTITPSKPPAPDGDPK